MKTKHETLRIARLRGMEEKSNSLMSQLLGVRNLDEGFEGFVLD